MGSHRFHPVEADTMHLAFPQMGKRFQSIFIIHFEPSKNCNCNQSVSMFFFNLDPLILSYCPMFISCSVSICLAQFLNSCPKDFAKRPPSESSVQVQRSWSRYFRNWDLQSRCVETTQRMFNLLVLNVGNGWVAGGCWGGAGMIIDS